MQSLMDTLIKLNPITNAGANATNVTCNWSQSSWPTARTPCDALKKSGRR